LDYPELTLNVEALKIIETINGPISVVGVAGMYRTGKSYLLNRAILNRGSGFGVAPTINACTKGIWLWGKPLKGESDDGRITNVLVVDSEGLGAVDQDSTHDCRIFAIVLLISSLFIYNSVGTIDENAINSLSLVINLTKHIHLKSQNAEDVDSEDYSQYFPAFLWVLRDFTLQLVDEEGDSITAKGYLEGALTSQKGFTDEVEQKNRIRRLIQTFFKERDCFTMVRPLTDEDQLQNLENRELKDLRSEFIEQVTELRKKIFKQSKIKCLNGKMLNGEMMSGLLKNYVAAINEGAVPNIENAWTYICKSHCHKLFENCFKYYDERFSERLNDSFPTSVDNLETIHSILKHETIEKFKKEALGDQIAQYMEELKAKIKDRYISIKSENKAEFEKLLQQSMKSYYSKIDEKVKSGEFKNYYDYERELQAMRTYFMDLEPQGPNKLGLINEFLFSKCNDVAHFLIKSAQNELENELAVVRETKDKLENDIYRINKNLTIKKRTIFLLSFLS
jgi:thymidylate synthase ThyX